MQGGIYSIRHGWVISCRVFKFIGEIPSGGLGVDAKLQQMIEEQRETIEKLEDTVKRLEYRVSASENFIERTSKSLEKISVALAKNNWITVLILAGVILLLGTE